MVFNTKDSLAVVNKEDIYRCVTELDLFKYYVTPFKVINRTFKSELRADRTPSAAVRISKAGRAFYVDFSLDISYTPIDYVMEKYNLKYPAALRKIVSDFKLLDGKSERARPESESLVMPLEKKEHIHIEICSKPFTKKGLQYWQQYGISKKILDLYLVKQLSALYIKNYFISTNKQALQFAYDFGNYKYKILALNNPDFKWTSNVGVDIVQGVRQLPKTGHTLFITKSLKDVMTLKSIGAYAIAPQSEKVPLNPKMIEYYRKKWKKIIIYFDNDPTGIEGAKVHAKKFALPFIHNPLGESKDPSDYYKDHGEQAYRALLRELLTT